MTIQIEHLHVCANGLQFHVAASGNATGPAMLLLHGFPEGWESWRGVMELLPDYRIYAPDLRGYPGSGQPRTGYDVLSLTEDVRALIAALGLERPVLIAHDWGGAIGWIFAHRFSSLIGNLIVLNCTHPKTLVRAVRAFDHLQTLRFPYVAFFQIPWLPEHLAVTRLGRWILYTGCHWLEGQPGTLDKVKLKQMLARFRTAHDMQGPIDYYRKFVRREIIPSLKQELEAIYRTPITVPTTLLWGDRDKILIEAVGRKSSQDAGCSVDFRPMAGAGHFLQLEAPHEVAQEIMRAVTTAHLQNLRSVP